jgi:hypothetical protein
VYLRQELCIQLYRRSASKHNELQITPVGILRTAFWSTDFLVWLFLNYDIFCAEHFKTLYVPLCLTFRDSTLCPHSACMCVVWFSQKQRLFLCINSWFFITKTGCVYCAVRTKTLKVIRANLGVWCVI